VPHRTKLLIGALGAATPLAINLIVVDHLALASPTALTVLGYGIRVAALVGLGILVVVRNLGRRGSSSWGWPVRRSSRRSSTA
jgi:hypothetical protein